MQRAAACLGVLALAVALGAMATSQLVVLPSLESQADLVDLNLLTRLAAPIHLRCAEIAVIASLVLVGVSSSWLRSRLGTTLALLATAGTGALRLLLLPSLYDAWARVDRVAALPYDRLVRAEGLAEEVYWLGLGSLTVLLLLGLLAGLHWVIPGPRRRPASHRDTTLSDDAGATDEQPIARAA